MYKDTMEKLGIKQRQLQPSRTVFHGIVPGLSCSPIGKIQIDVLFGDKDHFRRESVWFEVVDLESPYHALLGRPALAKFMAVTHHGYNVLKMPGNRDIITIAYEEKDAVCTFQNAYQAAAVEDPDNEGTLYPPEAVPKKKKQLLRLEP